MPYPADPEDVLTRYVAPGCAFMYLFSDLLSSGYKKVGGENS